MADAGGMGGTTHTGAGVARRAAFHDRRREELTRLQAEGFELPTMLLPVVVDRALTSQLWLRFIFCASHFDFQCGTPRFAARWIHSAMVRLSSPVLISIHSWCGHHVR